MQKNPQQKRDINNSIEKEEKNKKNEIKDFKDKQQIFMNQINPLSNAFFFKFITPIQMFHKNNY